MKSLKWFIVSLCILVNMAPSWAQSPGAEASPASAIEEPVGATPGTAADLRISPRVGIGHESSGAGFDGTTRFEGFIPLGQRIGENLTFLESHLLLDNDGNIGGNIAIGHRFYDADGNRIWGGYVGLDNRHTDENQFYQLAVGVESLGDNWDFRANGYLPLGETRQLIDQQVLSNGNTTVSSSFQGHLLVLENRQERRVAQTWEAALGGLDLEAGTRLAHWDDGSLWSYGGLYWYDGGGTDGTVGWRLRLNATPTDTLNLGASLQHDSIFGTNFAVSVGMRWPRVRPRGPIGEPEVVVARLGEPLVRNDSIAVDTQQVVDVDATVTTRPLMNPEEKEPYWFQHVTLGQGSGGNGTFENPFRTVRAGLQATRSDGNDVVYVDQGNNAAIPAVRIPDRVQLLSRGPVQILAGMSFPGFARRQVRLPFSPRLNFNNGILVRLPFSGDGDFPTIRDAATTDLVTLGDRTVLAGFQLPNASGNGIVGRAIANVELRDNTVSNSSERGIFLDDVADSVVLFNNTVTGSQGGSGSGQGILIRNGVNDSVEVTMDNQALSNNRVGLEIAASGDLSQGQGSSQVVAITDTNIQNNRAQGLVLNATNVGNQEITFSNGSIISSGADGVNIRATNRGTQEVTIEDSTIRQNGGDGIHVEAGVRNGATTAAQEVFISNNTIANNTDDGIDIIANEITAQEFAIEQNQILNNGSAGIQAVANNVSFQEYVTDAANGSSGINNNTITGNGDQGIDLDAHDSATLIADIQNNTLSNQTGGRPDLDITSSDNTVDVCVVVSNNTSTAGIRLDNNSTMPIPGLFEVGDLNSVSTRNIGPVQFLANSSTFKNKPGATSCFQ